MQPHSKFAVSSETMTYLFLVSVETFSLLFFFLSIFTLRRRFIFIEYILL